MSQQTSGDPGGIPEIKLHHRLDLALEYGKVTVPEVAEAIGYSEKQTRNYLRGSHVPRRGTVSEWALRCGVNVAWLRDGIVSEGPHDDGTTSDQGTTGSGCIPDTPGDVVQFPARLTPQAPGRRVA